MRPSSKTDRPLAIGAGPQAWIAEQRRSLPAGLPFLAGVAPSAAPWVSLTASAQEFDRLVDDAVCFVGFLATSECSLPSSDPVTARLRSCEAVAREWLSLLPSYQPAPVRGTRFDGPIHSFVCSAGLYRAMRPYLDCVDSFAYQFASSATQPRHPPVVLPPWSSFARQFAFPSDAGRGRPVSKHESSMFVSSGDAAPSRRISRIACPIESAGKAPWSSDERANAAPLPTDVLEEPVTWLIPHRGDAAHLHTCLQQVERDAGTHDSIWVCLDELPTTAHADLLHHHPAVHFWRLSPAGMGPYVARHILGQAAPTRFLLFQDSDDVPVAGRRNALVSEMLRSGADMIGSHELRVDERHGEVVAVRFPNDANAALETAVEHPLFHPTSLIRVEALRRAGGFSTAYRFGADLQFLLRAHFTMRLRNCDEFLYLRRKHQGSLTTSPGIGLGEAQRVQQAEQWKEDFVRVRDGRLALAASSLIVKPHGDLNRVRLTYLSQHRRDPRSKGGSPDNSRPRGKIGASG